MHELSDLITSENHMFASLQLDILLKFIKQLLKNFFLENISSIINSLLLHLFKL